MATLPLDDAQDLRDDGPGRLDRRVPVRVRGHARGAEEGRARPSSRTSSRSSRSTARARWTRSRRTRAASATRRPITYIDERLRPITESTKGVILYQEQAMQIAKSLAGFSGAEGGRPAQGDRQEEPRGDGQAQAGVRRRLPRLRHRAGRDRVAVGDEREVGRLLVQQVARRLLRADLLPHRVAEGQLPGRVHGRADLLGDGHEGQGPVLRRPGGADGDRDPAAGRQRVRPRVHGRRGQHPLRARRREGRRLRRRRGDQARRARRAGRSRRCGTSASASTAAPSTRRRSRR